MYFDAGDGNPFGDLPGKKLGFIEQIKYKVGKHKYMKEYTI